MRSLPGNRRSLPPRLAALGSLSAVATFLATSLATLLATNGAAAQDLAGAELFLGENGALQLTVMEAGAARSCNEVSFAAIPGDPTHVIGRHNNTCTGSSFSVARYAIDWNARTLTFVNLAFDTSPAGGVAISKGDTVTTAYDASVMSYGGELWVAFECGGNLAGCQTASSCVGPMNAQTGVIDPARTNVVVLGNDSLGDGYLYSASVPELLSFGGSPYIYWSAVKIDAANTSTWANITGRGMKLVESGGQLWNANTTSWVGSADPNNTVEVWSLGADASNNTVADLQGVFTNGTDIFVTAGVAGTGCAMPFWPPTCYSFAVSRTTSPLATGTFSSGTLLPASELPSNTHSYSRYIQDPDGRGYILGGYYTNTPGPRPLPVTGGPNAAYVTAYPIPSQSSYFAPLAGSLAMPTSGTAIANADGRLEAFVVGSDTSLYHAWQATPGGAWSAWALLATGPVLTPAVQRNTDGRLEVFAVGPGRAIVHIWQTSPGGAWGTALASIGGVANGGPAVDRNTDGTLDVLVVGTDGSVYESRQASSGWTTWASIGGAAVGSPTVQRNADGRLEVFVTGPDGSLSHASQSAPSGAFGAWASLGASVVSPIVQRNLDGRLEVFGVGAGDALFHASQTTPGGAFGAWSSLGGVVTAPTVGRNADGRLEVFAVGDDLAIYHTWQTTPGGAYSGWASLGGSFHGPSVQANADGALELLAVDATGAVQHDVQSGGSWSGWSSIGGSVVPYAFLSVDDDAPIVLPTLDGGADGGDTGGSSATSGGAGGQGGQGGMASGGSASAANGSVASSGGGGAPGKPAKSSSCGCELAREPTEGGSLMLLGGALALAIARGRRVSGRAVSVRSHLRQLFERS